MVQSTLLVLDPLIIIIIFLHVLKMCSTALLNK